MTLPQFADHFRLKLVQDECGDPIVSGRLGKDSNISDFSDTELAMCWLPDGKKTAPYRNVEPYQGEMRTDGYMTWRRSSRGLNESNNPSRTCLTILGV